MENVYLNTEHWVVTVVALSEEWATTVLIRKTVQYSRKGFEL